MTHGGGSIVLWGYFFQQLGFKIRIVFKRVISRFNHEYHYFYKLVLLIENYLNSNIQFTLNKNEFDNGTIFKLLQLQLYYLKFAH